MKTTITVLFLFVFGQSFCQENTNKVTNPNFISYKSQINNLFADLKKIDTLKSMYPKKDSLQYFTKLKEVQDAFFDTTNLFKNLSKDTTIFALSLKKELVLNNLAFLHYELIKYGITNITYSDFYGITDDPIEKEMLTIDFAPDSKCRFTLGFDSKTKKPILPFFADLKINDNLLRKLSKNTK
jgi:hypothetical protein